MLGRTTMSSFLIGNLKETFVPEAILGLLFVNFWPNRVSMLIERNCFFRVQRNDKLKFHQKIFGVFALLLHESDSCLMEQELLPYRL
jgi:hypothetical protein